jgi:hypothetical protein
METNLEKAKRLVKAHAAIQGIDLPDNGYIFKMLELAATPNYEKTLSRIAELEGTRQKLLLKYQSGTEEDLDSLASEIVNYKMIIMELENTMKNQNNGK